MLNEQNSTAHYLVARRTSEVVHLGPCPESFIATSAEGPDHSHGGRRNVESKHRSGVVDLTSDGVAHAAALFSPSVGGVGKGRASAGSHSENLSEKDQGGG
jgi:hypothetical protein